jgi:hypothetical protein
MLVWSIAITVEIEIIEKIPTTIPRTVKDDLNLLALIELTAMFINSKILVIYSYS